MKTDLYPQMYATNGGGLVIWEDDYYRWAVPPSWSQFQVGDIMPLDWSICLVDESLKHCEPKDIN